MQSLYVCRSRACSILQGVRSSEGGAPPSRLVTLPLLLLALELSQSPRPCVPPLDDQAVLVGQQAGPLRPAVVGAHHQETLAHLDLGTLAAQVLHMDPEEVVAPLQRLPAALVDRRHVDRELGPVAHGLHVQNVHLHSLGETSRMLDATEVLATKSALLRAKI